MLWSDEYMKEHNLDPDQEQVTIEQKNHRAIRHRKLHGKPAGGRCFTVTCTPMLILRLMPPWPWPPTSVRRCSVLCGPDEPKSRGARLYRHHFMNPHGLHNEGALYHGARPLRHCRIRHAGFPGLWTFTTPPLRPIRPLTRAKRRSGRGVVT